MKTEVKTLGNEGKGEIELSETVFNETLRPDIVARMVKYQLAKRRAGTHKTKGVSEISGTTKKPWKQKGTGRARQGSLRSPQFKGGATIFGPVVRSHEIGLPKKVRKLALRSVLTSKRIEGKLIIMDSFEMQEAKSKTAASIMKLFGFSKPLFVDGPVLEQNFSLAMRNIKGADVLPQQGANVYDILNHHELVLSKDAVAYLESLLG